jgi:hypothetical protein
MPSPAHAPPVPERGATSLTGRSRSLNGSIARTEISTDGGRRWQLAVPRRDAAGGAASGDAWQLCEFPWRNPGPGSYPLRARATDIAGLTQPAAAAFSTLGYQFDGIVRHPVTVA